MRVKHINPAKHKVIVKISDAVDAEEHKDIQAFFSNCNVDYLILSSEIDIIITDKKE